MLRALFLKSIRREWQREGFSVGVTCRIMPSNEKPMLCHKIMLQTGSVCKHLGRRKKRGVRRLWTSSCNSIQPIPLAQHHTQKQLWIGWVGVASGLPSRLQAPQAGPKCPRHSSDSGNPHSSALVPNQLDLCQCCCPAPWPALVKEASARLLSAPVFLDLLRMNHCLSLVLPVQRICISFSAPKICC